MQTFLLTCQISNDLKNMIYNRGLMNFLHRLSFNSHLDSECELFWVFYSLARYCLLPYYSDDAQIKFDLFTLEYVLSNREEFVALKNHLNSLGISVQHLFGECFLEFFAENLSSEMFFLIMDKILLEKLRSKIRVGLILIGVAITVLKSLEKNILHTKRAEKVISII